MVLGICSAPEVLEVMRIVKIVITIIKIVVPILLIIFGMITYVRAITDSDNDNITKAKLTKKETNSTYQTINSDLQKINKNYETYNIKNQVTCLNNILC